jgi:hypothetical protein
MLAAMTEATMNDQQPHPDQPTRLHDERVGR